jgi:hypothetical protein
MRLKLWICVVLACAAVPTAAAREKLAGKVLDAAALNKVKTYCVDTSNLKEAVTPGDIPRPEEFDVRELVKRESGRKGLISKLPWTLVADCAAPGVDAAVSFQFRAVLSPGGASVALDEPVPYALAREFVWRAELQVTDKASTRVVYEAEGNPVEARLTGTGDQNQNLNNVPVQRYHVLRQDAAYHALAALASDVKAISKNP